MIAIMAIVNISLMIQELRTWDLWELMSQRLMLWWCNDLIIYKITLMLKTLLSFTLPNLFIRPYQLYMRLIVLHLRLGVRNRSMIDGCLPLLSEMVYGKDDKDTE